MNNKRRNQPSDNTRNQPNFSASQIKCGKENDELLFTNRKNPPDNVWGGQFIAGIHKNRHQSGERNPCEFGTKQQNKHDQKQGVE